jgi:hypothetical protein
LSHKPGPIRWLWPKSAVYAGVCTTLARWRHIC